MSTITASCTEEQFDMWQCKAIFRNDYMSMKHAYINAPIIKQSLLEPPHLSSPAQPDTSSSTHNVAQPTYSTVTSSQHTPLQIQDTVYNPSYGALSTEIMQLECMYDCLDYPLPFNKLVEENAVDLPLQVDICESIYGMVGGDSLFQNEKLDVYFMKHTEVVKISKSGVNCSNWLPLSSAYQCNVFTCENGWQYAAKKKFSSMESLLKASTLPLVVYVTSDKKSLSIQAGELLIIKSVELSKKNKVKSMNCWSISTHKKKHLDGSCVKYFSINPEQTKVYIHDVIEHYKLPMYAIFYFSPSSAERVTIEEKLVMKSAIARKVAASESSDEILEIMLMAELMMRKREVANKYHAELVKQSCSLYEKFNPALVNKVIPSICGFDSFQTQLFRHVLANWSNSTELYYPKHAPPINSPAAAQDLIIPSPPPLPPSSRPTTLTAATDTCNNESVDYEGVYYAYDDTVNDPISIKETEPLPSWRESSQRYQYLHENHKILITYTTKQVNIIIFTATTDLLFSKQLLLLNEIIICTKRIANPALQVIL